MRSFSVSEEGRETVITWTGTDGGRAIIYTGGGPP